MITSVNTSVPYSQPLTVHTTDMQNGQSGGTQAP